MSSVPMPRDLSEEAVAEWVTRVYFGDAVGGPDEGDRAIARAVRALLREKVREAVFAARDDADETDGHVNAIVARVLGEEAPRG